MFVAGVIRYFNISIKKILTRPYTLTSRVGGFFVYKCIQSTSQTKYVPIRNVRFDRKVARRKSRKKSTWRLRKFRRRWQGWQGDKGDKVTRVTRVTIFIYTSVSLRGLLLIRCLSFCNIFVSFLERIVTWSPLSPCHLVTLSRFFFLSSGGSVTLSPSPPLSLSQFWDPWAEHHWCHYCFIL